MNRTGNREEERTGQALEFAVPVDEDGRLSLEVRLPRPGPDLVRVVVVLEEPDAEEIVSEIVESEDIPAAEGTSAVPREGQADVPDPAVSSAGFLYAALRNRLVHGPVPGEPLESLPMEGAKAPIVLHTLYRMWEHAATQREGGAARLELSGPSEWHLRVACLRTLSLASSSAMPEPSSRTSMRSRPPSATSTSTRVAPASSAFSQSSLTTEAGRSTTSPAATCCATRGSSNATRLKDQTPPHVDYTRVILLVGSSPITLGWHRVDNLVWYEVFAFAHPAHPLAKAGRPLVRPLQSRLAADSLRSMAAALEGGER